MGRFSVHGKQGGSGKGSGRAPAFDRKKRNSRKENRFGASNKSVRRFPDNQMTHITIIWIGLDTFAATT